MKFHGTANRRIYGAVDVAKAARNYGPIETTLNADSYAQFALGNLPLMTTHVITLLLTMIIT